jgi:hypothetical protein
VRLQPRAASFALLILALFVTLPARLSAEAIGSLHCNDGNGVTRMKGQAVTVAGTVVGQFSTERNVRLCVEDRTGAVTIYGTPKNCAAVGDSVRVTGVIGSYNGLTEITGTPEKPVEIERLGHASWLPAPLVLTLEQVNATEQADGCEPNESRLVQIDDVTILSGKGDALAPGSKFADDTNYRLVRAGVDSSAFVILRVTDPEGCDLSSSLEGQPIPVAVSVRVTGVLSQYAGRSQGHGGYQILPRDREDIVVVTKPATDSVHH